MKVFVISAAFVLASLGTAACAQAARHSPLTIDMLMDIKHPSEPVWSPDGHHIAFVWERAGVSNLYVADAASHGTSPVALTKFPERHLSEPFWSHDGSAVYFTRDGQIWKVSATGGEASPAWTGKEVNAALSPDGKLLALVRSSGQEGGDLVVRSLSNGAEKKIAHDDASIHNPVWSPDGSHLVYTAGSKTIHHDEAPGYSGAKIIYRVTEQTPGKLMVVAASGGDPDTIAAPEGFDPVFWSDPQHLVFDRVSSDFKSRMIYVAEVHSEQAKVVHRDTEELFWSIPWDAKANGQPSPDGRWIAFISDRDGWDHLYVMPAQGGDPVQITKGNFEAWRPAWSHDGKRIAFDANEPGQPGDRHLYVATIGTDLAHVKVDRLTSERGTDIEPSWSPDDKELVYQHTDPHNSADLFAITAQPGARPNRLSDSMPAEMDRTAFVEPQFVHYPGADGKSVPGWLFVPKDLDRTKKHPVILWIHGDGINQNYDGWHVERNYAVYYSFHQYLLQKGYIVFAPDYRGSTGYGRDWRDGVYMDIGDRDAKDAWMAANYLKTLDYVDPDRIGVWGLSYGGFFTLIAMTDQPTLFRAGVDVAGVVDYVMYYGDPYHGEWTASRIGTPEQNPQVYANASPLSHIDQLQRPLLVLHGTADVNVPYLESVRLIDEALKKNKGDLLQFMMYPGEFHYFDREHVLRDAWHRVDDFFGQQLSGTPPPTPRGTH